MFEASRFEHTLINIQSDFPSDYDCHSSSASTNHPVLSDSGSFHLAMVCILVVCRATYTAVPPLRLSTRHELAWKGKEGKTGS